MRSEAEGRRAGGHSFRSKRHSAKARRLIGVAAALALGGALGPVAAADGVNTVSPRVAEFYYNYANGDVSFVYGPTLLVTSLEVTSASGALLFNNASSAVKNSSGVVLSATQIDVGPVGAPGFQSGFDFGLILPANLSAAAVAADDAILFGVTDPGGGGTIQRAPLNYFGDNTIPANVYSGPGGNWSDASQWSFGRPPKANETAQLSPIAGDTLISFDAAASGIPLSGLSLNATGNASVTLSVEAGTLQVNGTETIGTTGTGAVVQSGGSNIIGRDLQVGDQLGTTGTYLLSGGTLQVGRMEQIGAGVHAVFNQTGGYHRAATINLTAAAGETSTFNLAGGTCSAGTLLLNGPGRSTFNMSGGTCTTSGVSFSGTGNFTFNLSDGTLSETTLGRYLPTNSGTVLFNQTGGLHSTVSPIVMGQGVTYNLSGGTLAGPVDTSGIFNYSGGSLIANSASSPTFTVRSPGLFIATGTGTRTIELPFNNLGTFTASHTVVQFTAGFSNGGSYISDHSDNYFNSFTTGEGEFRFVAAAGDRFLISGDVSLNGSAASTFDVGGAEFHLVGGGVHQYTGTTSSASIPILNVDPGNTLNLDSGVAATIVNNGHVTVLPSIEAPRNTTVANLIGPGDLLVGAPASEMAVKLTVGTLNQPAATINKAGTLILGAGTQSSLSTLNALTINPGGKLDVNRSALILNYGTNTSPIPQIRSWLSTGSGGSNHLWNGTGITSSFAAANRPKVGVGYTEGADGFIPGLTPGQLLIRPTPYGDVNFDGKVDQTDINQITARGHYNDGAGNHVWADGDLNYDGVVNITDLRIVALSGNYGGTLQPALASAAAPVAPTPSFAYDPATGDVTLLATGVVGIDDLHLRSAKGLFLPQNSTFVGFTTTTTHELEDVLLGQTFGDGYDLGDILPAGLTTAAVKGDLTATYGVSGSGIESAATVVPEPVTLGLLSIPLLLGRRKRRSR